MVSVVQNMSVILTMGLERHTNTVKQRIPRYYEITENNGFPCIKRGNHGNTT